MGRTPDLSANQNTRLSARTPACGDTPARNTDAALQPAEYRQKSLLKLFQLNKVPHESVSVCVCTIIAM